MKTQFARQLRKNSTHVEKILWLALRNRNFHGLKFRRQQPIGPYVADFVCFEKKAVLEFDGPHHQAQKSYDQSRDQWFEKEGYRVLRISNDEFLSNELLVMKKIEKFLMVGA